MFNSQEHALNNAAANHASSETIPTQKITPLHKYERLAGVEWLRIIACFGIVWFHVKAPGAAIAYGGLPAFMIISVAFAAIVNKNMSAKEILISRFHRMGVPWLFWSIVYGIAKISQALMDGRTISSEFTGSMVLFGPSLHLWYLPFGMLVTAIVSIAAQKGYLKFNRIYGLIYIVPAAATIIACSWLLPHMRNTVPFSQWVFIFPAIFIGLTFAVIPSGQKKSIPYLLGILAVLGIACLIAEITTYGRLSIPYIAGICGCVIAWSLTRKAGPHLVRLASLSFGVYLVHPLVALLLLKSGILEEGALMGIVVFIISVAITRIIQLTSLKVFV